MDKVKQFIAASCKDLFGMDMEVELSRPDEQFGDYATNVALQLAGKLNKNPKEIAEKIVQNLKEPLIEQASDISIAGPGFINIRLSDQTLANQAFASEFGSIAYANQTIVVEYSDPNPFKILHAGHLYTSIVGDAIANLFESAGAQVHRVNYGGDVGLHVGKTMWAILEDLQGEYPDNLLEIPPEKRAQWMADAYISGTQAYEDNEAAKAKIIELNKRVYELHSNNDHDSPFARIYWTCREWSYEYFNQFYARIGSYFEKYYPESEVAGLGLQTVKEQLEKGVFERSDGAIVFRGEPYGLHTRVFVNSEGIPTYEAKDVGLIMAKQQDYHFDKSVIITGNEQEQYMAVVLKAIEQFAPELARATQHITHGMVRLQGGEKMSSRKGNILRATDVLDAAAAAQRKITGKADERVELGAVKYALLKQRTGGDIIYDPEESVSLEGNSGPYLQYAYARARSVLQKAVGHEREEAPDKFEPGERSLARKISEYSEVVDEATRGLMPHLICTYLYELAQIFNRFYEHNRIIGHERQAVRLKLVAAYAGILKNGLEVLGISAPDRM